MTSQNISLRSFVLAAAFCATALLATAQQSSNGRSSASSGGQKQSAEVRTEKFKVKQEFGPQTTAHRNDRTSTATPPGQNGGSNGPGDNGSSSSADKFKQEFGPQSVGTRKDRAATAAPPSTSGQGNGPGNGKAQQSPSLFTPDGKPTRATATLANPGAKPQSGTVDKSSTTGTSGTPVGNTPNSTKSQSSNPQ
jgi:hypothetical protein